MSKWQKSPKRGWGVGVSLGSVDDHGFITSVLDGAWYGFDNKTANALTTDIKDAVEAVIMKYRQEKEKDLG